MRTRTRGAGLALSALTAVTALTALAACGSGDDGPDRPRSAGLDRPAGLGTVTVLAASSLTEAMASTPGSSPRSSAASVLISDTMR